jgi:hypothetical protein
LDLEPGYGTPRIGPKSDTRDNEVEGPEAERAREAPAVLQSGRGHRGRG